MDRRKFWTLAAGLPAMLVGTSRAAARRAPDCCSPDCCEADAATEQPTPSKDDCCAPAHRTTSCCAPAAK